MTIAALARTTPERARWAVAAIFAVNGFVIGAWAPQIPLLLPRLQIDRAGLGALILVLGLGAVGAMLFSGRLIARFGTRRVLSPVALLLALVLPLVVMAPSVPLAALAMACFGAVAGTTDVVMNANAVEVERRLGRAILSSMHGFWSIAGFAGASTGGLLIEAVGALPHALAVMATVAVAVILSLPHLWDEPPVPRTEESAKSHLLPRDPALWLLGALALLSMVPEGAVMDWGALYLTSDFGATTSASGLAFGCFAGAMASFRFAGDRIRNRFGAVRSLRVSALAAAAGLFLAAMAPGTLFALAAFTLCGLGVANIVPVIFSAAGNHPGLPSGTAVATVTMVGYAGILVAPFSIGFAAEHVGFRPTFAVLALLLLIVASFASRARAAERD